MTRKTKAHSRLKGVEGVCIACSKPIHAHYGQNSRWAGCEASGLDTNTPFILVPARRRVDEGLVEEVSGGGLKVAQKAAEPLQRVSGAKPRSGIRPEVVYVADKRVKPEKLTSPRMQIVLATLQAHRDGLKRKALLKKFHASNRPGSINSAIRRLMIAGAVRAIPIDAEMTA